MRSISIPQLYSSLYSRLIQVIPDRSDSQFTNLAYLILGIIQGRSVQLGRIAAHLPIRAKKQSLVRRLERLVGNGAVRVRCVVETSPGTGSSFLPSSNLGASCG
jgi:hypothetical protein